MAVRSTVASCLIASGRAANAGPLLTGIDRTKVSELVGDASWGANLDLALSKVLTATGSLRSAREHLLAATRLLGNNADNHQRQQIEHLSATLVQKLGTGDL